jgi:hypothetical protein
VIVIIALELVRLFAIIFLMTFLFMDAVAIARFVAAPWRRKLYAWAWVYDRFRKRTNGSWANNWKSILFIWLFFWYGLWAFTLPWAQQPVSAEKIGASLAQAGKGVIGQIGGSREWQNFKKSLGRTFNNSMPSPRPLSSKQSALAPIGKAIPKQPVARSQAVGKPKLRQTQTRTKQITAAKRTARQRLFGFRRTRSAPNGWIALLGAFSCLLVGAAVFGYAVYAWSEEPISSVGNWIQSRQKGFRERAETTSGFVRWRAQAGEQILGLANTWIANLYSQRRR